MKKGFVILSILGMAFGFLGIVFGFHALAQEPENPPAGQQPSNMGVGQLIDQYATVIVGWEVEQRCDYLDPQLEGMYGTNQQIIEEFMIAIMTEQNLAPIKEGATEMGQDDIMYPCSDQNLTFVHQVLQLSTTMAERIQAVTEQNPQQ